MAKLNELLSWTTLTCQKKVLLSTLVRTESSIIIYPYLTIYFALLVHCKIYNYIQVLNNKRRLSPGVMRRAIASERHVETCRGRAPPNTPTNITYYIISCYVFVLLADTLVILIFCY